MFNSELLKGTAMNRRSINKFFMNFYLANCTVKDFMLSEMEKSEKQDILTVMLKEKRWQDKTN